MAETQTNLPRPTRVAEERWLQKTSEMLANHSIEQEEYLALVAECVQAGRPTLGAKLLLLLPEEITVPPGSPLERAQRAAKLVVHHFGNGPKPPKFAPLLDDFVDAWTAFRRRRVRRIINRMKSQNKRDPRARASTARRKPRLTGRNHRD